MQYAILSQQTCFRPINGSSSSGSSSGKGGDGASGGLSAAERQRREEQRRQRELDRRASAFDDDIARKLSDQRPDIEADGDAAGNQAAPSLRDLAAMSGLDLDRWIQGEPMSAELMLMAAGSSVMFKTAQMLRFEPNLFWTIASHLPTYGDALANLLAEAIVGDPETEAAAQMVVLQQTQQSDINPLNYISNPNYDTRNVDESFVTEPGLGPDSEFLIDLSGDWLLWGNVPILNALSLFLRRDDPDPFATDAIDSWADRNDARQRLLLSAWAGRLAGNDDAARNLEWFVLGMGQPMTDYPVDKMINELGIFEEEIAYTNERSLPGLLNRDPAYVIGDYDIYVNNTDWRRVGQGSDPSNNVDINPYLGRDNQGISTDAESPDAQYMISGTEPTRFTREQYDWFIAMNAFDYSTSQVVVVNRNTGEAQLHYRVDVADEYAWYVNDYTGKKDAIMAMMDEKGVGEWFPIRGSSSIYQRTFHIEDDLHRPGEIVDGKEVTEYYYDLYSREINGEDI